MWKEIMDMKDPVDVKYTVIEELFCENAPDTAKALEKQMSKKPAEVHGISTY